MKDELAARQRAIHLRLAGRAVQSICSALGRGKAWFCKWWGRYLQAGPEGLYDRTRANHHVARRIPPELERAILSVRRRLQAHASPATRYSLIGAAAIRAELNGLGVQPLPCERTIERALQRNGLTAPRVRLAPLLPRQEWPGPQARASNELHEVDLVGPVYLQGRRRSAGTAGSRARGPVPSAPSRPARGRCRTGPAPVDPGPSSTPRGTRGPRPCGGRRPGGGRRRRRRRPWPPRCSSGGRAP